MKTSAGISVAYLDARKRIALVTLDRPPVNALDLAAYARLRTVFRELDDKLNLRAAIITASGDRAFVGGSDMNEFRALSPKNAGERARVVRGAFEAIRKLSVPVIGAINGVALGAGMAIASYCDILVASENAVFGLPEINVGVLGGTKQMSRLVPQMKLRWLSLTGSRLTAAQLAGYGAIEAVVPSAELRTKAKALAMEIARKSPAAVRLQKQALNLTEYMNLYDGYQVEQLCTGMLSGHPESKEAAAAFFKKRSPSFAKDGD